MQKYLRLTRFLTQDFNRVEFTQILKSQNMEADKLAKQVLSESRPTNIDLEIKV